MPQEILYTSNCDRCESHKSELGILLSIKESIKQNFLPPEYTTNERIQLIIVWFEQYKLDERTKLIQGYKQSNIKEIRK